ncbi:MAK10-like protein [Tanacetum coccineum]
MGILENVLVKIDKFVFPSNFVVINMLGDPNENMILGRSFLATIHARINVFRGKISLGIRVDKILFDINGNVHHPNVPGKKVYMANSFKEEESFNPLEIGYSIYGMDEHGVPKHWYGYRDNERQEVKGKEMVFSDFLMCMDEQCIHGTTKDLKKKNNGKAMLDDELPLGRANGSRFKGMIQKEMDIGGSVSRET